MHLQVTELNESHLKMVEEMGSTGFSFKEIAEVLEVEEEAFLKEMADDKSSVKKRYRKGYLMSQLKLRQRIFKDAGHGSSPAQTLAKKIMYDCEYKMKEHG